MQKGRDDPGLHEVHHHFFGLSNTEGQVSEAIPSSMNGFLIATDKTHHSGVIDKLIYHIGHVSGKGAVGHQSEE